MRIEAKVLWKQSELVSGNPGPRGLLPFADDENPYVDTPVGVMLAYAMAPIESGLAEAIETALSIAEHALMVQRLSSGRTLVPACNVLRSNRCVTVLHMNQLLETSSSSWIVTTERTSVR